MPLFSRKPALASAIFIATAVLLPSSNAHGDFGNVDSALDGALDGAQRACDIPALATCCDWGGGVPCLKQSGCTEVNFVDIGRTAEQCTLSDSLTPMPGVIPTGSKIFKSKSTGYFPDSSLLQGGYVDRRSKPLQTLQQYLRGKGSYVSVAMDNGNGIPYGTKLRILELERKYGRVIEFRVVDTGGAFYGKGMSRIDICTESENHAYDPNVNKTLTLVFPSL